MREIPQRFILAFILCLGTISLFCQRMNLNIAILCMSNHSAFINSSEVKLDSYENNSDTTCVQELNVTTYVK